MSPDKITPVEAALRSILVDHFENSENPHVTIYKISLVMKDVVEFDGQCCSPTDIRRTLVH